MCPGTYTGSFIRAGSGRVYESLSEKLDVHNRFREPSRIGMFEAKGVNDFVSYEPDYCIQSVNDCVITPIQLSLHLSGLSIRAVRIFSLSIRPETHVFPDFRFASYCNEKQGHFAQARAAPAVGPARLLLPHLVAARPGESFSRAVVTLRPWAVRWPRRHRGAMSRGGITDHDVLCTGRAELIVD